VLRHCSIQVKTAQCVSEFDQSTRPRNRRVVRRRIFQTDARKSRNAKESAARQDTRRSSS
jgi:hypothetical protein